MNEMVWNYVDTLLRVSLWKVDGIIVYLNSTAI